MTVVKAEKLEDFLYSIKLYDNTLERVFTITNLVTNLSITTYIQDNAGKCTFDLVLVPDLKLHEGSTVSITVNGKGVFKGYLFTIKISDDRTKASLVFYDLLRYLKNKDSKVFENKTSSQIFTEICQDQVIPFRVVDASSHICTPRSNDNKGLYEMIKYALDDTLIHTKQWYIIRDNYGRLEHINILNLNSGVIIGDNSGLLNFDYERSIDSDVYNQIKLYRDNKDTKKREIFIVNDTVYGGNNLKRWGILQLYDKVDDNLNKSQIEELARKMLYLYNSPKKKLKLNCLGTFSVNAGSLIQCKIKDFFNGTDMNSLLLVTECTHTIGKDDHKMSLNVEVY